MSVTPLVLPALRGWFGDWTYYSCLFPLHELGARVDYANVVHKDQELSKLIQRILKGDRAARISRYLSENDERFFNSLVLATYGGDPHWIEIGNIKAYSQNKIVDAVPESAVENLGFLYLTGTESIFAVDGQHRLAGIKAALKNGLEIDDDFVPVIIVGHKKTKAGLQRTRRLFTTLNKTAVPVKVSEIIALDEDDAMAITARRMVEDEFWFKPPKIQITASRSMQASSHGSLTTIPHLYDILKRIFKFELSKVIPKGKVDETLRFNRPEDDELERFHQIAVGYFTALAATFPPVGELLRSRNPEHVTPKYRHEKGGHLIFRPVGLEIVTRLAIEIAQLEKMSLPAAVRELKGLPVDLANTPYRSVIWVPDLQRMQLKGKGEALDLCRHMLGLPVKKGELLERYRALTKTKSKLPIRVRRPKKPSMIAT